MKKPWSQVPLALQGSYEELRVSLREGSVLSQMAQSLPCSQTGEWTPWLSKSPAT